MQQAFDRAVESFTANNPNSKAVYEEATKSLPGGNTRLYDVDGHEYVDLLGEYTAGLYGHSEPVIASAISDAVKRGLNFGGHHEDEPKLAALVKERFPSIDLVRFTNSGTEATLMALAVAKVFTNRKKILVFDEAYHGGSFIFHNGESSLVNAPHDYLVAEYNDLQSVHRLMTAPGNRDNVAAIIVEPMIGSGGAIRATDSFLLGLRKQATESGAVLIFDEVMTSRMHSGGGIQSQLPPHLRPDITTLGKYIGGGMSFGAFGGKREIMSLFDPRRADALGHAGTFNNNVLTMAAGRAGLEKVFTPERARRLHETGEELRKSLQRASQGIPMQVTGRGSILCFHFCHTPAEEIKSPRQTRDEDRTLGAIFHLFLLERGYYIARRGFMALNLALSDKDLDGFRRAVVEFIDLFKPLIESAVPAAKL